MITKEVLLLMYDQLSVGLLEKYGKGKTILMVESESEWRRVGHHKKKLVFFISAMRHFFHEHKNTHEIQYIKTDKSLEETLKQYSNITAIEPGEWHYLHLFNSLKINVLPDTRFICSTKEFQSLANGKRKVIMEQFYRSMRKKTGLLMHSGLPVGGKWNFDHANRNPMPRNTTTPGLPTFHIDEITKDVIAEVEKNFKDNFGDIDPFWLAVTATEANQALDHFLKYSLDNFGTYQDAMAEDNVFLFHSGISAYLNLGLLDPYEVCKKVEQTPGIRIESTEAFIRQILGWREFVRGIYFQHMPQYLESNYFDHHGSLPDFYWTGETDMNCIKQCVQMTKKMAYSHHIQRLMVTGNFANLMRVHPKEVHNWYLCVYADAHEWVEVPNTIGMALYADGGIIGTKPYIASSNYINKMSNFCKGCKLNPQTCPFRALYWKFIEDHRGELSKNPRMRLPRLKTT